MCSNKLERQDSSDRLNRDDCDCPLFVPKGKSLADRVYVQKQGSRWPIEFMSRSLEKLFALSDRRITRLSLSNTVSANVIQRIVHVLISRSATDIFMNTSKDILAVAVCAVRVGVYSGVVLPGDAIAIGRVFISEICASEFEFWATGEIFILALQ